VTPPAADSESESEPEASGSVLTSHTVGPGPGRCQAQAAIQAQAGARDLGRPKSLPVQTPARARLSETQTPARAAPGRRSRSTHCHCEKSSKGQSPSQTSTGSLALALALKLSSDITRDLLVRTIPGWAVGTIRRIPRRSESRPATASEARAPGALAVLSSRSGLAAPRLLLGPLAQPLAGSLRLTLPVIASLSGCQWHGTGSVTPVDLSECGRADRRRRGPLWH
jgi:hypothetical protein